ncbi:alpha/beta fold hydrolase [Nonomuraea gerenzanensis]|uniref:Hydrolase, alpha/beta hydrolase fold family n=1 Tax=Nonomuraea gerenzanensis TaxID=93944 RepID=A0A1M4EK51_9ACTN|nr:alpha/beta fold hydrolase [Nonomuraea gerenzanensis]UBU10679.1 alpha/beta hydrolase [Nonomuraea gerenzanensis]SBO99098.1 Hydrolase, alpha/beta hydrolase fold family [Nonomuraea gerenzanensis]
MAAEFELTIGDGRVLHVYDTAPGATDRLPVLWHHGTPNIGAPPAPLLDDRLGLRWISYDRPGYGGSTPEPGRTLASVAGYATHLADALGLGRFAVIGHSGGGSHALACAALLGERVLAAVSVSGLAPLPDTSLASHGGPAGVPGSARDRVSGDAAGSGVAHGASAFDWFAGMAPSCEASLRAAVQGRAVKERHEAAAEYDPEMFTQEDHAAFEGEWSWFDSVVGPAVASGPGGLIADDLAYVSPWGCDVAAVTAPILLVHGDRDRVVPVGHGGWLARHCPTAQLRVSPGDGHISVLPSSGMAALEWLATEGRRRSLS